MSSNLLWITGVKTIKQHTSAAYMRIWLQAKVLECVLIQVYVWNTEVFTIAN